MDKITDERTQLFTITMEECGELVQACSKVMRRGADEKSLKDLMEEAGDVLCMLKLLQEWDYISWQDLENRVQYKKDKLKTWSNLIK
jgi:NTP pyrophosphatase (non-canonical NTP hydrolase)